MLLLLALSNVAAASPTTQSRVASSGPVVAASPIPATPAAFALSTAAAPSSICALNTTYCGAATGASRVQLTAMASGPTTSWPAVQIAFVIETTAYDGVYDPNDPVSIEKQQGYGYDSCGAVGGQPLCEESNGVPFFESNVPAITSAIQSANPHSQVTYAMVDFAETCDLFDDYCDQVQYHVDQSQFVDGTDFTSAVASNFRGGVLAGGYTLHDEDLADNFLHVNSITALYGVISGSGLDWSNNTHHVIIWMGSGAPRDPSYVENYCVSPSAMLLDDYGSCYSSTCEPAFNFGAGVASPQCEGWIHSQDGNPKDSIAGLAHTSPNCVNSVGGVCTIDVIDLWDTPTDPFSMGWPNYNNGYYPATWLGPGAPRVVTDSFNILNAGCDMAAATGGTWDGPTFYTCPDGQSGGLQYVPHGPVTNPNIQNPTLLNAFREVGFGPVEDTLLAVGGKGPMFTYLPPPNFALAAQPEFAVSCTTSTGFGNCPTTPSIQHVLGTTVYGWNWSANASLNRIYYGDTWHMSFNVVNTGPPYGTDPVLTCATPTCLTDGSRPYLGLYSWAQYLQPNSTAEVTISFPVALVVVSLVGVPPGGITPPPEPLVPPPVPVLVPTTVNNPVAIGLPVTTPVGSFSLQATAAGLLMAGITRLTIKNKPIAMQIAAKNGPAQSKFDAAQRQGPDTGHFE